MKWGIKIIMSAWEIGTGRKPKKSSRGDIYAAIDDAIWSAMGHHEPLKNDSICMCGVHNNMDGDVLFSHRAGAVSVAVRKVIDDFNIDYCRSGDQP